MTEHRPRKRGCYVVLLPALIGICLLLAVLIATVYSRLQALRGDLDLVRAAAGGNTARVRSLLSHGSHANSYHPEGSSALWWAVSSGNPECVQLLLQHGADPNSRGQFNSVIDQAVQDLGRDDGRVVIAQALLDHEAQIKDPLQVKLLKKALAKKRAEASSRRPPTDRKR